MDKSGVYKITNTLTGKFYIGSSNEVDRRFYEHKRFLNNNNHKNIHLQRAWNVYGESTFIFGIIEECPPEKCLVREQYYIDLLLPHKGVGYNINATASGGDTFTNNPRKEIMREKNRLLSMGEGNGMFGKKHSEESLILQKEKAKGRYSLNWFIERDGETLGPQKYQERRQMLANRKINYKYDNGLKGKKVKVESTRGASVSAGRRALKERKPEFLLDIKNPELSSKQISDKFGISISAVKYHRNKITSTIQTYPSS